MQVGHDTATCIEMGLCATLHKGESDDAMSLDALSAFKSVGNALPHWRSAFSTRFCSDREEAISDLNAFPSDESFTFGLRWFLQIHLPGVIFAVSKEYRPRAARELAEHLWRAGVTPMGVRRLFAAARAPMTRHERIAGYLEALAKLCAEVAASGRAAADFPAPHRAGAQQSRV
jgi:hypothetical protein